MDIDTLIKTANLGHETKDAQVDTCTVFAAALYDVLSGQGMHCRMVTAMPTGLRPFAHAVVEVDGKYYDSMGEFSTSIYRTRAKIHPKVALDIEYKEDSRSECYEPEFEDLCLFFTKVLTKALGSVKTAALLET